ADGKQAKQSQHLHAVSSMVDLAAARTIGGMPLLIQGCAFTAGAAAGAAGAEALEEEGYELESPVQEADDDEG
ncbi:MAG TPA: hypothetical protein VHG33_02430, partial [Woeseiaceae bacterium]|nr:hypothetical protein [Woeseiaceae bacterium]